MNFTVDKMKCIATELGFSCDNRFIYYREASIANYISSNSGNNCTVFFSSIEAYGNSISFRMKLTQIIERFKREKEEEKLEKLENDCR